MAFAPRDDYVYSPLTGPKNIRILRILKSKNPNDPLVGELVERDLGKAKPTYEAVSYTWDGQQPDHYITIDGRRLAITKNCFNILHDFRNPKFLEATSNRRLWIDSICINQKDNVEKCAQIELMHLVYAKAAQVLIWLGPPTEESERMFEIVRQMAKRAWNPFMSGRRRQIADVSMALELQARPALIFDIISRSWFTRVWTLQEACFSPWAVLRCGRRKMLIGSLFTLADYAFAGAMYDYHNIPVLLEHKERFSLHFRARITLKRNFTNFIPSGYDNDFSITETLRDVRKCGAFEPKDRIFAIHAMCRRVGLELPPADYTRTRNEIYHTATVKFLQKIPQSMGAIQLLLLATGREATHSDPHPLPSWVPDYNDSVPPWLGVDHKNSAHKNKMPSDFKISPDNLRLSMPAVVIDRVAEASTHTTWHPNRIMQVGDDIVWETLQNDPAKTISAFQDWIRIAKKLPYGCLQMGHSMREAFFATIGAHRGEMNVHKQVRQNVSTSAEGLAERVMSVVIDSMDTVPDDVLADLYEDSFECNARTWWSLLLANDDDRSFNMACLKPLLENASDDTLLSKKFGLPLDFTKLDGKSAGYKILLTLSTVLPGICESLLTANRGDTFFRTDGGYFGAGTSTIRDGDLIVLIGGMFCPMAVRPTSKGSSRCRLIGPTYVHGVQKGELWGKVRSMFLTKSPRSGDPKVEEHGVSRYYCDLELV
ncbi:hypothetical protein SLS60_007298 [Paraconiothyrium brasiliense]|uniref:Heterokaryon incompatibility domain-containing protein n=1 Tax=Paraconiothyrium brasiliense TaxID=300254 RepID=A0ABR3R4X3_9PLEO